MFQDFKKKVGSWLVAGLLFFFDDPMIFISFSGE
jgi:hypothetical protein